MPTAEAKRQACRAIGAAYAEEYQENYRNQFLVTAMVGLKMVDTIGSGIRKMYNHQRQRLFPLPDYNMADNRVEVTITGKILDMNYANILAGNTELNLLDRKPAALSGGQRQRVALGRAIAVSYTHLVLKKSAKDVRDKYVEPPYTTTFGILFLPFEGLYAEVVNLGLLEVLQREYNINVAGPSTMAALLSSLQMGFRTLAIQKRSSEVWQVLGAVKTEFGKFEEVMRKMQGHLQQTSSDLETLMGTRTRAINRKLRDVQQLDDQTSRELLEGDET